MAASVVLDIPKLASPTLRFHYVTTNAPFLPRSGMSEPSSSKKPGSDAPRTRASVPRPRSGCDTCKRRHVKCDETKPECLKCVQTGRKCDGYSIPASKTSSKLSTLAQSLSISSYDIPFKIPGSQNDRRIFHYYCVHASKDLAGVSKSDFWIRLVLQCSQDEPVVRSALLALSYEHLDYITRDTPKRGRSSRRESRSVEGLQQHHKAVRQLRKYIGTSKKPSVKAILVCCILFYHFECSRDDYATALLHLHNGLAIFRGQNDQGASSQSTEGSQVDADMQELMKTLSRLDTQASMMDTRRMPELDLVTEENRQGIIPLIAPTGKALESLQEADIALARLQNWSTRFIIANQSLQYLDATQFPPHVAAEKTELLNQCSRWSDAVDALQSTLSEEEGSSDNALYLAELRLGLYTLLALIQSSAPNNPTVLQTPNAITQKAVEQLAVLVPAISSTPDPRLGNSQNNSPTEGSGEEDRARSLSRSRNGNLQPPGGGHSRSRSGSPSPLPDSVSTRSYCAQGNAIISLIVLASKTTSAMFRMQLIALLSSLTQRREGPYSGAVAYAVLHRLQDLDDDTLGGRRSSIFSIGGLSGASGDDGEGNGGSGSSSPAPSHLSMDSEQPLDLSAAFGLAAPPVSAGPVAGTLSQQAWEFASHMLDARPFCAVAASLRRGYHADRCVWCEERNNATGEPVSASSTGMLGDEASLEEIGARRVGGVTGFERLLQERMRKSEWTL